MPHRFLAVLAEKPGRGNLRPGQASRPAQPFSPDGISRECGNPPERGKIKSMKTGEIDPKTMAVSLLLLSKEAVSEKCKELNIPPSDDKFKMIDKIIVSIFGLDACKKAFSRRS